MMNSIAAGAYVLVLVYGYNAGGLAMYEFPNYESCKAAITQIQNSGIAKLRGFCVAKDVKDE